MIEVQISAKELIDKAGITNGIDGTNGLDGLNGSPDTALQIADKLNLEEGIIEQKVIIGLEESLNKKVEDGIQRGGGSGGIFLHVGGAKKGKVNSIDFAGATYSKVNGLDTVTVATPDLSAYLTSATAAST